LAFLRNTLAHFYQKKCVVVKIIEDICELILHQTFSRMPSKREGYATHLSATASQQIK
jgi:hypothetical protein